MKPNPKNIEILERLKAYHDYGVEIGTRTISLNDEISDDSIDFVLTNIDFLESIGEDPIRFLVSTYGGDMVEMVNLVDIMRASNCVIETVAKGKCMSAGPLLVAAGDPGCRSAYKNVQWMIHVSSGSIEGTQHEIEAEIKWHRGLDKMWLELLEECSSMPQSHWKKLMDRPHDTNFNSEQALEWGLIDWII